MPPLLLPSGSGVGALFPEGQQFYKIW